MGQSSSKKQKKSKEADFPRTSNTRPSKRLNNTNVNHQRTPLNEHNVVKNDIKSPENQQKPSNDLGDKVNNTCVVLGAKNVDPNNINTAKEDSKSQKDLEPLRSNGTTRPVEDDFNDLRKHCPESNVVIQDSTNVDIRHKNINNDHPDGPVKMVRSASAGGDLGHAKMRKFSMRESTEIRRRQFYNHMLNNTSQFDADQGPRHLSDGPKHLSDGVPIVRRDSLHSLYNFNSDVIREYDIEQYPEEFWSYAEDLSGIERDLRDFSKSQITVHFPTLKDKLHNNWRKVFAVKATNDYSKGKKIELINRVKFDLDILNSRYLGRRLLFVKY